MAGKPNEQDIEKMASDATQALGPIARQADTAFKLATQITKQPGNGPVIEKLRDAIDSIVSDANGLKDLAKQLKQAT